MAIMNAFKYSNIIVYFFTVLFCVLLQPTQQDLSKFILGQGSLSLSLPERHLSNRVQNVLSRVKRQQLITVSQDDVQESSNDIRQPAVCGINGKSRNLITKVDESKANDWPWMAAIVRKGQNEAFCGGALINRNYVLTAAHCFVRDAATEISVRLGEYDFETPDETKYSEFGVQKIISHPLFDDPTHLNDVALLKLEGTVQYNDVIRPICLPTNDTEIRTNETVLVAGWGSTAFAEVGSPVLLEVGVPVRDLEQCRSHYGPTIFDQNVCASGYEGNKDSCPGDSGGPLIKQLPSGRWVEVGIVSWGKYCGQQDEPGVYANVKYFLDWIRRNMADAQL